MRLYQQTIILFGLILPLLLAAGVFGVCFMMRGNVKESLSSKGRQYSELQQSRRAAHELERQVNLERENLERWSKIMSQETTGLVTATMRQIQERIPDREFTQTSFERPPAATGFATATAQRSSQIRMSFRGNFRSVQSAFLELETRLPQLQLQELRIAPNPNQPSMLNVNVSYTAWEK